MGIASWDLPPRISSVVDAAVALPALKRDIVAIGLAGSWARGAGRDDSDVDLIVLTTNPSGLLADSTWYSVFGDDVRLVRSEDFNAIQERRLKLLSGLEIEVGIGSPAWADTDPVDPGTTRVVRDGLVPIYDPAGSLFRLIQATKA